VVVGLAKFARSWHSIGDAWTTQCEQFAYQEYAHMHVPLRVHIAVVDVATILCGYAIVRPYGYIVESLCEESTVVIVAAR
jgi:hypothetical protein